MELKLDAPERVFISYAYDGKEHLDRVRHLCDTLRTHGVDAIVDQYFETSVSDWVEWMTQEIDKANYILVVCSAAYYERISKKLPAGIGLGLQWEGGLMRNLLYKQTEKPIIVIQFDQMSLGTIPTELIGKPRAILPMEFRGSKEYEKLHRIITSQPEHLAPELGKVVQWPQSGIPAPIDSSKYEIASPLKVHTSKNEHLNANPEKLGKARGSVPYTVLASSKLTRQADSLENIGDFSKALECARKAVQLNGLNIRARSIGLRCAIELGDSVAAAELLPKDNMEQYPLRLQFLALTHQRLQGNEVNVDEAALKLFTRYEGNNDAVAGYFHYLCDGKQYKLALEIIELLVDVEEYQESYYTNKSYMLWREGDIKGAFELLVEAQMKLEYTSALWCNFGIAAAELGFFGIATDAQKRAFELDSNNQFCQFVLAEIYALMNRADDAVDVLLELYAKKSSYLQRINSYPAFQIISDTEEYKGFIELILQSD